MRTRRYPALNPISSPRMQYRLRNWRVESVVPDLAGLVRWARVARGGCRQDSVPSFGQPYATTHGINSESAGPGFNARWVAARGGGIGPPGAIVLRLATDSRSWWTWRRTRQWPRKR